MQGMGLRGFVTNIIYQSRSVVMKHEHKKQEHAAKKQEHKKNEHTVMKQEHLAMKHEHTHTRLMKSELGQTFVLYEGGKRKNVNE